MTSISASIREIKPQAGVYYREQEYTFAQGEREVFEQLKSELATGRFHRCPKCLRWVNNKSKGAVMSHTLRTPDTNQVIRFVAFPLCKKCANAFLQNPTETQRLVEAVKAYFGGEYVEVAQ